MTDSETESVGSEQTICIYHSDVVKGFTINGKKYGKCRGYKQCIELEEGDFVKLAVFRKVEYEGSTAVSHLKLKTKKKKEYKYYGTKTNGLYYYKKFEENEFHKTLSEVNDIITDIKGSAKYG